MLKELRLPGDREKYPAQTARRWGLAQAILFLLLVLPLAGRAASFTATVDRDTLTAGESVTLSLNFEGGEPANPPAMPAIPGLSISDPSRSVQQFYSFNGAQAETSIHTTYSYSVTPAKPGDYTIPGMTANIGGQKFASSAIHLKVLPPGKGQASAGGAFLKLLVPKTTAYLGEIIPVDIQLYCLSLNGGDMPELKEEGFTLGKMLKGGQSSAIINGRQYQVISIKTFVVPAKVGKLDLGPATMQVVVPKPNSRQNIFGELVDWQRVNLESEPFSLQVLPLPKTDVPPTFTGAVGSYSVNISANPTNVAVGDPITVKVEISGRGALDSVTLPQQTGWNQFKGYPPTSDFQPAANDPLGVSGTRTFALTVVPQTMDIKELPAYSFSFFNPDQKSYRTVTQPPVPLIIRPSAASLPPPMASNPGNTAEPVSPGQDVSLIKSRLGFVAQIQPPLLEQPWFIAVQGIPVLAWLALLIKRRNEERLANNPRLRRERQVEQIEKRNLLVLRQTAKSGQAEAFFAMMVHLLQERIGERLDLPASAITEAILDERLRPLRVPEEQLTVLRELFQLSNQSRYGHQATNEELESLVPKVEAMLTELKKINA